MATKRNRTFAFILFAGDVALLYAALWATIMLKYPSTEFRWVWELHRGPFFVVFFFWILIFFIAGLYEKEVWSMNRAAKERLSRTIVAASVAAALLFYLIPAFGITPKTNLVIQSVLSFIFIILWRLAFSAAARAVSQTNVLFFGLSGEIIAFAEYLKANPHLGYNACCLVKTNGENLPTTPLSVIPIGDDFRTVVKQKKISLVVASTEIRSKREFVKMLYDVLPTGVAFTDFASFYESITGKIPVSLISEIWFLENITEREKRVFEVAKRGFDIVLSIALGIPTLLLYPAIALAICLDTKGPPLIRQKRTGRNGETFILYKFRSMVASGPDGMAEQNGARWAEDHDPRITRVGNILRKTRIDELPQLWNVIRGELSFIGPRPERPEFIETLKREIPFYEIRLLVRPGLSGWAQINFPYGASVKDAMEKLQYDLYYIKNRSFVLDVVITLRTLLVMASGAGK